MLIALTYTRSPYFGQAIWFMKYHPERVPSAVERYQKEVLRVFSVLDGVLAKAPGGYLVGGKLTIADLSFIPWNRGAVLLILKGLEGVDVEKQYPAFYACVIFQFGIWFARRSC